MRVATAPVSFGVFELTADGRELPGPALLLDRIAETGYAGTELGPPGYLGSSEQVARELEERSLDLVGAFLPLGLTGSRRFGDELAALEETLDLLEGATPDGGARPLPLLADDSGDPARLAYAGRIEQSPWTWLGDGAFRLLADNAQRAAERCRERGFEPAFHPHAGTHVETPRELDRFMSMVDPELLPLCFDTGHCAFGGGRPLETLAEYADAIAHVHLKDVDPAVLDDVRARGLGLEAAWEGGAFCRLGEGSADVAAIVERLQAAGYRGWLVVEQDRTWKSGQPFEQLVEDAAANRAFLSALGL